MKYQIKIQNLETGAYAECEKISDETLPVMIAETLDYLYMDTREEFLADLNEVLRNPNEPLPLPARLPRTELD